MCCNTRSVLQAGKDMGGRDCIAIQFLYCNLVGLKLCCNAQDCIAIEWQLGWKLYCRGSVVLQYSGVQWVQKKKKMYCNTLLCIVTGSGARGEAVSRHGQARVQ